MSKFDGLLKEIESWPSPWVPTEAGFETLIEATILSTPDTWERLDEVVKRLNLPMLRQTPLYVDDAGETFFSSEQVSKHLGLPVAVVKNVSERLKKRYPQAFTAKGNAHILQ